MKNVAEAKRLIEEKHQQVEDAKMGLQNLLEDITEKFCPVKVGDVVKVTGHAYTGRKMKIHTVTAQYSSFNGKVSGFRAKGHVLKGNGDPSYSQVSYNDYPFTDPF